MENLTINDHYIALEFDKVLSSLSKYAISSLGKKACFELEINNIKEKIEYELNLVDSARRIIDFCLNKIT